jgi:hypothetical protein
MGRKWGKNHRISTGGTILETSERALSPESKKVSVKKQQMDEFF